MGNCYSNLEEHNCVYTQQDFDANSLLVDKKLGICKRCNGIAVNHRKYWVSISYYSK
jgi:hypothetical protein